MKSKTILLLCLIFTMVISLTVVSFGSSTEYPSKPITIVVPYGAGGGHDLMTRSIAMVAPDHFGVPVVVENKSGGMTIVGVSYVAKAKPDGYTLLATVSTSVIHNGLGDNPPVNVLDDTDLICMLNAWTQPLIGPPDSRFSSGLELFEYARNNPGELKWGLAGARSAIHLAGLKIQSEAGILGNFVIVPYDGGTELKAALLSGEVDIAMGSEPWSNPGIAEGIYTGFFTTGKERAEIMPDVPTLIEYGIDMEVYGDYGIAVPKGTPQEIKDYLEEKFKEIAEDPKLQEILDKSGDKAKFRSSEEYTEFLEDEYDVAVELKDLL